MVLRLLLLLLLLLLCIRSHRLVCFLSNSSAILPTCRPSRHVNVDLKRLIPLARVMSHIKLCLHVFVDREFSLLLPTSLVTLRHGGIRLLADLLAQMPLVGSLEF